MSSVVIKLLAWYLISIGLIPAQDISNLSILHALVIKKGNTAILKMVGFSSLRFSKLYLSTLFSLTCRIDIFEKVDIHDKSEESVDAVIEHVNYSNGFTVIGWYKCGRINDQMSMMKQMIELKQEISDIIWR